MVLILEGYVASSAYWYNFSKFWEGELNLEGGNPRAPHPLHETPMDNHGMGKNKNQCEQFIGGYLCMKWGLLKTYACCTGKSTKFCFFCRHIPSNENLPPQIGCNISYELAIHKHINSTVDWEIFVDHLQWWFLWRIHTKLLFDKYLLTRAQNKHHLRHINLGTVCKISTYR